MPQGITNNKRSPTDQISPNSYCGKDLFKILIDKKLIDIKSIKKTGRRIEVIKKFEVVSSTWFFRHSRNVETAKTKKSSRLVNKESLLKMVTNRLCSLGRILPNQVPRVVDMTLRDLGCASSIL